MGHVNFRACPECHGRTAYRYGVGYVHVDLPLDTCPADPQPRRSMIVYHDIIWSPKQWARTYPTLGA